MVGLIAIVLALPTGAGVVAYVAMGVVVRNRPRDAVEPGIDDAVGTRRPRELVAYSLIAVGLIALAGNFGLFQFVKPEIVWPAALVVIGTLYLAGRSRD